MSSASSAVLARKWHGMVSYVVPQRADLNAYIMIIWKCGKSTKPITLVFFRCLGFTDEFYNRIIACMLVLVRTSLVLICVGYATVRVKY